MSEELTKLQKLALHHVRMLTRELSFPQPSYRMWVSLPDSEKEAMEKREYEKWSKSFSDLNEANEWLAVLNDELI